jgi:hypothetical protein
MALGKSVGILTVVMLGNDKAVAQPYILLPSISADFLNWMMAGVAIERVHVSVADGEFCYEFE